ncbi:MAG TPA: zinc-ribbon domain-containing protein, partial [Gemmatimonadales bacterium]|nr:zinc-ribbon domain-containing protein [Gemmatimonadales bacterium]
MNVTCPSCQTVYRVDPAKVPPGGVRARCAVCSNVFPVNASAGAANPTAARAPAPAAHPPAATVAAPAAAAATAAPAFVTGPR